MHAFLLNVIIYLGAAVIAVPLFRKFKIGAILAYLFVGILIGPQVLTLIKDPETILHLSELGVVFLLFIIGLELQPSRLWQMRHSVFGLGAAQVFLTGAVFTLLASALLDFNLGSSIIVGFGLALSSTAFGIQLLEENRQLKTLHGQGSFSILLFQDLAVVPLIAMVPLLSGQGGSVVPTWTGAGKAILTLGLFVFVGLFLVRYIFRFIAESRVQEVFTAATLLVVCGSALLMEEIGLSMGMGAFIAGMLLANSEYRHELEINLEPFKGLLLGLFFIAVGMSLDLQAVFARPWLVVLGVIVVMLVKAAIIYSLARLFRYPNESARNMASTLPQGGEFAFVLFAAAMTAGLMQQQSAAIMNAIVTVSMALTPFAFKLNQKYLKTFTELSERPMEPIENDEPMVIIAGYGRFGQIVSRMLQAENVRHTILEHSAAQVDIARKFGRKIYYGDASRKEVLEVAGAANAKKIVIAIDEPATSVKTVRLVKEHFPNLEIYARVRNRSHAIELLKEGVEHIHRETFLTSLEVSKDVLLDLGLRREYINRRLAKFRHHDEEILRGQVEHFGDEERFFSFTNKANAELSQILAADAEEAKAQLSGDQPHDSPRA